MAGGEVDGAFDAVVVGAGFAGLYMLHRLRGLGLKVRGLEAGDGVGGTWYWNRYPGARCDIESLEYSYQFDEALQQEWSWRERYAAQPEILRYLNHVADRFDLRRDIELGVRVTAATWDEGEARWTLSTEDGRRMAARFLVMATGCLSRPNTPKIEGLERFRGEVLHTGTWPHEGVDFTGQRVALIGTGSSAVQSIPLIAAQARQLTVFQRTATYVAPARNGPLDPEVEARVKADYKGFRARASRELGAANFDASDVPALAVSEEERRAVYDARWARGGLRFMGAFADLNINAEANATAAEFLREKIRAIVKDPAVAEILSPRQTFGCKRMCVDSGYFETFNLPHVALVDAAATPIEAVTATGVRTRAATYEVDSIVLATGFDAMTGALLAIDIRGRDGLPLKEAWAEGPKTYLGVAVAGFPNLFTISGPGSPSVLSNMVVSIEQHVDWIADCIGQLQTRGLSVIEADAGAQEAWVEHVNAVADSTLFPTCNSWYLGANVPGKPRVFMPYLGFPAYAARCAEVAADGYEGFATA